MFHLLSGGRHQALISPIPRAGPGGSGGGGGTYNVSTQVGKLRGSRVQGYIIKSFGIGLFSPLMARRAF